MKLSHAETQALISARLDGPLDPVAERELTAHLASCESCRAFNASASQLARGLQSLPYLPASPAVARAVLDHVSTPRSPFSWFQGALPANALPAASAIAVAVIVVFVGSFAAFRFLDEDDQPSTIPASTLTVTDLAQGIAETADASLDQTEAADTIQAPTGAVEGQSVVTEESGEFEETAVVTEASGEPAAETATNGDQTAVSSDPSETEIGPPPGSDAQRLPPTDVPALDPTSQPTAEPAATEEPVAENTPNPSQNIRILLGLETAVPTEPPAAEPSVTPAPTEEPIPTDVPTSTTEPTSEPTATEAPTATAEPTSTVEPSATTEPTPEPTATSEPTEAPTATAEPTSTETIAPTTTPTEEPTAQPSATDEPTQVPSEEPAPTEVPSEIPIVEPPESGTTDVATEPPVEPTSEPTDEPTEEPTQVPTEEPTEEPTPIPATEPPVSPTATVVRIEQRGETPVDDEAIGSDETGDTPGDDAENSDGGPTADEGVTNETNNAEEDDPPIIDSEGADVDASPGSDQVIQDTEPGDEGGDGDGDDSGNGEQVIEPAGGDNTESPEDSEETPSDEPGQGNGDDDSRGDEEIGEGDSDSLADAPVYAQVGEIPGDPTVRLGLSADGELIFSTAPGRVSLEQNGILLDTTQGPLGQVVEACDTNGSCVDISSASANVDGHIDNPIGWLGGEVIYERIRGDQFPVEFRAISLESGEDRLIDGGEDDLERFIRPYPADGALLVPSSAGWLRITSSSVEIVDDNPYGSIDLIRIDRAAGRISYVSGGTLVVADLGSPGSPILELPFAGSDYDFSPDGSQVAVVTGGGIDILGTSGNLLASLPNEDGIAIGSLAWLSDGLVFVDLSNGVVRIIEP